MSGLVIASYFVAGLFGLNGVPHFYYGVTGRPFMSPFGRQSSAAVNLVWGASNFVISAILLILLRATAGSGVAKGAFFASAAIFTAFTLLWYWSNECRQGRLPYGDRAPFSWEVSSQGWLFGLGLALAAGAFILGWLAQ